jgi:cytochrome c
MSATFNVLSAVSWYHHIGARRSRLFWSFSESARAPTAQDPLRRPAFSRAIVVILVPALISAAQAAGDAARGADIFRNNCSMCHSPEPGQNLVGPSLFSVVGRAAASLADFSYSAAMKRSRIVWTAEQLKAFLKAPRKYVPGAAMMFPGLTDEQDREDVVAFLATLQDANSANPTAADPKTP